MQTSKSKPPLLPPKSPNAGVSSFGVGVVTAASMIHAPILHDGTICQGWMLKKRRKKMQGYARRYFLLSSSGVLSYSMQPGGTVRDQIHLKQASISSSSSDRNRSIHIDASAATFHCKALSATDYALWMSALRRFCTFESHTAEEVNVSPRTGRRSLSRSMGASFSLTGSSARLARISYEIGLTIQELEDQLADLKEDAGSKSRRNSGTFKHKKEKDRDKEHHEGLFGLFHRKSHNNSAHSISPRPSTQESNPPDGMYLTPPSPSVQSFSTHTTPLTKLAATVASLRAQHSSLLTLIEGADITGGTGSGSPLRAPGDDDFQQSYSPHNKRHSMATLTSGASVWFDADDGAEEFILEDQQDYSESRKEGSSAVSSVNDVVLEEDEEDEDATASDSSSAVTEQNAPSPGDALKSNSLTKSTGQVIIRRTRLPAPTSGDDGSLLQVLRKNVGKDLSTVSFPVSFNEPISILQRLCEDVEYVDLLAQAAGTTNPVDRICFVTAFAVSGYACSLQRASRKPFNPMLGETYEYIGDMKFVAEKVSHHPPIMAVHASGKGWEYWATSGAESKFWGRSLEIINHGTTHAKIADSHYQWQRPSSFMRNLIVGEKYLSHEGEMVIKDANSGYRSVITFKEAGYWGATRNGISAVIYEGSSSKALAKIEGTWSEGLNRTVDASGSNLKVLWRAHTFPSNSQQYYGFTSFAMGLNEITPDISEYLPPTDSRFRPDQRAMEQGKIEDADMEKERIEMMQRKRRRDMQERGEEWDPRWFEKTPDGEWVYKGGYWEARASRKWPPQVPLW